MVKLVNLWGVTGSNILETGSALTFEFGNTGTGNALQVDSAGTVPSLVVTQNALGGATIAPLRVVASVASQAVLQIQGILISHASLSLAASSTAFIIPVYHATEAAWGYVFASKGIV